MKKYLKISACAMMALAMALTITSCKKDNGNGGGDSPTPEVTCDYSYITSYVDHSHTIGKLSPTSADEIAINTYFNEKV